MPDKHDEAAQEWFTDAVGERVGTELDVKSLAALLRANERAALIAAADVFQQEGDDCLERSKKIAEWKGEHQALIGRWAHLKRVAAKLRAAAGEE